MFQGHMSLFLFFRGQNWSKYWLFRSNWCYKVTICVISSKFDTCLLFKGQHVTFLFFKNQNWSKCLIIQVKICVLRSKLVLYGQNLCCNVEICHFFVLERSKFVIKKAKFVYKGQIMSLFCSLKVKIGQNIANSGQNWC